MVKFVRLSTPDGGWIPVNPEAVQYLRQTNGLTTVVFGAMTGGLHEVSVIGDVEQILAALEGHQSPALKGRVPPAQRRSAAP